MIFLGSYLAVNNFLSPLTRSLLKEESSETLNNIGGYVSEAFSWGRHSVIADEAQHTRGEGVRVLQRKLYRAAKEAPQRQFGVLYDKVYRRDVLEEAWRRVRRNRGSAGVDKQTVAAVEARLAALDSAIEAVSTGDCYLITRGKRDRLLASTG